MPWNGSLFRLLLNSWQMLWRRCGNCLRGIIGSGGISSIMTWFTQMLKRRLGGSFLADSSGRLGFGAMHLGNSFGGGRLGLVRLNLGSFGFTVGKKGDEADPGESGECRSMLLSTAFLSRGSLMLETDTGGPTTDRPSDGET